jgi:RNA polymerase sigma-B factor
VPFITAAIQRRNGRVDHYRQLVRPIALHYAARCREPLDDLVQVGLLGLLRAAERYAEASGTPFAVFARPHIRGAILHYLRDRLHPIRLPRQLCEQLDRRRRCLSAGRAGEGEGLGDEQLRQAMGLSSQQWQQLERARQLMRLVPLEAAMEDTIAAPTPEPEAGESLGGGAMEALARLEPALAEVVQRVVLSGWSYRRTASLLAVSPMTVQRRLHRGLALLRQQLAVSPGLAPHPVASDARAC